MLTSWKPSKSVVIRGLTLFNGVFSELEVLFEECPIFEEGGLVVPFSDVA